MYKKGEWNSCAAHQAMGLGGSSDRVGWERMPAFAKSVLLALTGSRKMEIKPITNHQSPITLARAFWIWIFHQCPLAKDGPLEMIRCCCRERRRPGRLPRAVKRSDRVIRLDLRQGQISVPTWVCYLCPFTTTPRGPSAVERHPVTIFR